MNTHIFSLLRRRLGIGAALTLTLASACSGSLADDPCLHPDAPADATTDSILRFPTIADLESITPADLPGDFAGYELTDLSYECVDTIELRALRLDVTAGLTSPSGQKRTLTFTADVGPELVSVEYYPGGDPIPPHDNITYGFSYKVERYRNYSDGSRIGPDEFYGGNWLTGSLANLSTMTLWNEIPGLIERRFGLIPTDIPGTYDINPEKHSFKNGVVYNNSKEEYVYNMNTTVIGYDGRIFTGEDLLPIRPRFDIVKPNASMFYYSVSELRDDFYGSHYHQFIKYNTEDEETKYALSLGRDVPDVSPNPFPSDKLMREPAIYVGEATERSEFYYPEFHSNFMYHPYGEYYEYGYDNTVESFAVPIYGCCGRIGLSYSHSLMYVYLLIDGRIIHFNELLKNSFYRDLKPSCSVSKESDGYMLDINATLYHVREIPIKCNLKIHIKTVYGPSEIIDKRIGDSDDERFNIPEGSTAHTSRAIDEDMPRVELPDNGRTFSIDRTLPTSLQSVNRCSIIKSSAR